MQDKWIKDRFKYNICDVQQNYNFYFKWLLSKLCQCFVLKNLPETINPIYLKSHLLLDGNICVTDFNNELYACVGAPGGEPDEYYVPTLYTIANPILGSKQVKVGKNGVVIYNTAIDQNQFFEGGLFQLVKQTATLLADNIVSINCAQINTRVEAVFTADSEGQAVAGEAVLKKLYSGQPFQVLRSDIVEKMQVNPIATAATSNKIRELVELHNYIRANFFQSIGIKSNDVMKKERLITDEIEQQNDYLAISILDIITSWQAGFDKVNEMYGTDIQVELNPVLIKEVVNAVDPLLEQTGAEEQIKDSESTESTETETAEPETVAQTDAPPQDDTIEQESGDETQERGEEETKEPEPEQFSEQVEELKEIANEIVEISTDTVEGGEPDDSSDKAREDSVD